MQEIPIAEKKSYSAMTLVEIRNMSKKPLLRRSVVEESS